MADKQYRVTFEPQGRTAYVLAGMKVLEAAGRAGLTFETPCGGAGVCGKCRMQVTAGAGKPTQADADAFRPAELLEGWRLACQTAIVRDVVVRVPELSLFGNPHQILMQARDQLDHEVLPAVRKVFVRLKEPTLADHAGDLLRIEGAVGKVRAGLDLLRELPSRLRQGGFAGTAVLTDHNLVDFEPGDTSAHCCGAAFDIGTTTLVGSLLDLRTGDEKAIVSAVNPQVSFGDDVLSRIHRAGTPAGREELRKAIVKAVNEMIHELCCQGGVAVEHVYEVSLAGNTTMQHLLCGLDVSPLGQVPFVPTCGRGLLLPAGELGLAIHRRGAAYVFPVIGGFVGGDTVAGILATRLAGQEGPVLMVDIGTNGEIVLAAGGKMWTASTAAGPAFEGARISCGMRATAGAIEKVVIDEGAVHVSTIGGKPPVGLCGSGLIDAAADMLTAGLVSPEGRLLPPSDLPAGCPKSLSSRVLESQAGQVEFVLAERKTAKATHRISLTQRDIRELQLASGAIRAGIRILLRQAGLTTADLRRVLIAGGFGSFIRRSKAQRIGLLPADIDHRKIAYVGNTSLDGARWALLSTAAREQAEELARSAAHVQLSEDPNFQTEFAEAMIFPGA